MNLNPLGIIALLSGMVLLFAGIKNKYPQDVIREALGKTAIHGPIYVSPNQVDSAPKPGTPLAPGRGGNPLAPGVPVTTV